MAYLSLNTIKTSKDVNKKKKRVGRGNSSGHGTYSCRGIKGQRARSGGKGGLKRKGFKDNLLNIPKLRGFKSAKPKNQIVNLESINKHFHNNDKISPKSLLDKKLIDNTKIAVKILGKGELKLKNLRFSKLTVSRNAKAQIEKNNGVINYVKQNN